MTGNEMNKIEVIVHENETRVLPLEDGMTVERKVSTVAMKWWSYGEQFGDYIVYNNPTLTAQEVANAVNSLIREINIEGVKRAVKSEKKLFDLKKEINAKISKSIMRSHMPDITELKPTRVTMYDIGYEKALSEILELIERM